MSEEMKDKKVAKSEKQQAKDHWFTISGITKEAKRVRWPHWTNQGSEEGTLQNTGEVLVFTIFFALFFVLCDLGVAYLMKVFGIGA